MATILVADDDEDVLVLLEVRLGMSGHEVSTVTDGTAALEALSSGNFDLALLDVQMPGHTGIEVARAMRAETATAHIPVMLLSAWAGRRQIVAGLTAGADVYRTKPFTWASLAEDIDRLLTSG